MFPVVDDYAAIAQRLKEIRVEVAKERAATDASRHAGDAPEPSSRNLYDDMSSCA
jgi:hypothetical protein